MGATMNEDRYGVATLAITTTTVLTVTAPERTFTLPGAKVGDIVIAQKPSAQAGLAVAGARITAADTLGITFVNPTAAGILPTAGEVWNIFWFRPEKVVPSRINLP